MDILGRSGLEGLVVHVAPAAIGIGQAGLHRNAARAHAREHVQHGGLHIVLDFKLDGAGFGVDRHGLVLRTVLDHAGVVLGPGFFEQGGLGRDILVGVQNQHLGARLGLLEVIGHLAGALVGAGRAAVRRLGNGERVDTTVGHGFELLAQGQGFGAGLPGLQHLARRIGGTQAFD